MSGGGPRMSEAKAQAVVDDLRAQAELAPTLVAQMTELSEAAERASNTEVLVVDRAAWAAAAAVSIEAMLPPGSDMLGTGELALVLSAISPRILGQFDPYSSGDGRLYLVAPNVAAFRESYNLDQRDLALWVAVHELTHAVQFAAAPWLKDEIIRRAHLLLGLDDGVTESKGAGAEHSESADSHGESVSKLLEEVTAIMSLLEGHAEYAMNRVPRQRMLGRDRIIQAMADRRANKNPLIALISKRIGAADKLKQYTGGEKFVEAVIDRAGMEVFNLVWERSENLPTAAEIKDPAAWIKRVG